MSMRGREDGRGKREREGECRGVRGSEKERE